MVEPRAALLGCETMRLEIDGLRLVQVTEHRVEIALHGVTDCRRHSCPSVARSDVSRTRHMRTRRSMIVSCRSPSVKRRFRAADTGRHAGEPTGPRPEPICGPTTTPSSAVLGIPVERAGLRGAMSRASELDDIPPVWGGFNLRWLTRHDYP